METTRKIVREVFKKIGYKVSFPRNPFNDSLCNIAFKTGDMLKPIVVAAANCQTPETYEKHRKAFELALSFKGFQLTDTDQKIV